MVFCNQWNCYPGVCSCFSSVRRLSANSILLVMLGVFLAPAITAIVPQPVAACCRRGGAHHCAMMAASLNSSGTSFRSDAACPMRQAPQLGSSIVGLTVSTSARAQVEARCIQVLIATDYFHTIARNQQQRGPPPLAL
jgi:hypothetical protein